MPLLGDAAGLAPRLRLPPLAPGRAFASDYDVALLVDQREQLSRAGAGGASRSEALDRHLDELRRRGVAAEKVTLHCGDMLWVARRRGGAASERYVLDFVAERKSVQDLLMSIAGQRYAGQKANMRASGLARLLYIVEGAAEGIPEGEVYGVCVAWIRIKEGSWGFF